MWLGSLSPPDPDFDKVSVYGSKLDMAFLSSGFYFLYAAEEGYVYATPIAAQTTTSYIYFRVGSSLVGRHPPN